MSLQQGQDARSGAATLAETTPTNGNGNGNGVGADATARDLLFIEQLRFGQAELASDALLVAGLLHDSVSSARPQAEAHEVELSVTRCDRVVSSRRGDRRRLMQAFDHLIINAIQFSPKGSEIQVQGILLDNSFMIEIVDQGPGIPDEELESLFDAFFRGSAAREQKLSGRGIGLTVARAIIEAHGGSVRLANRDGAGTSALVELPS